MSANGNGNGNGNGRWQRILLAISLTIGTVSLLLNVFGESPLAAQRRENAVAALMSQLTAVNVALTELRDEISEWKRQ